MKIAYNWLKEYIDIPWTWLELVERLTMAGLEIEGVEELGNRYQGVVVGRVVECSPHPGADRLRVCRVEVGRGERTIVCGASNVAAGQKVAVMLPGFRLPGGVEIKTSHIRGVESQGMICSAAELDLGEEADGILVLDETAEPGTPFARWVGLDDVVLDIEVTPNRPDCLSLWGIAREVRALTGNQLRPPPTAVAESGAPTSAELRIDVEAPQDCPRYVGRLVRQVRVGPSPPWLQRRLQIVGQRPINNVVDVTNYVLLELGQPLHAFDLDRLQEKRIAVRRARPGETIQTLDGVERALDQEMLVIADGHRPVALAGVMGSANSEVNEQTTQVLLESAYFAPSRVRRTRARLGLQTEAAMRFERGADWDMPLLAADRAARLIAEVAGGQVAPAPLDVYPRPCRRGTIRLRVGRANQLLATSLDRDDMVRSLDLLGCAVESQGQETLQVTVPSFRPDLEREADLIEEVGRLYGYDRIPGSRAGRGPWIIRPERALSLRRIARHRLLGLGLDEVVSNTIVEANWLAWANAQESAVRLANPPTESQNRLRTTLVPSLLDVARRNFNQRAPSVAVFELGKCFAASKGGLPQEQWRLAGVWAGQVSASPWRADAREVDFFDLKGLLEAFLDDQGLCLTPAEHSCYRSGHAARLSLGDVPLGFMGQVHSSLCAAFDIGRPVHIFEMDFAALVSAWKTAPGAFAPLAKFPPLERDLAVVVRQEITSAALAQAIRQSAPGLIEAVEIFDLYQGDQIAAGHKSLAFSIRLRDPQKTLRDAQADAVIGQILRRLEQNFGARLR
jgi:phenylalanyl-tRNA synthetase beta chain